MRYGVAVERYVKALILNSHDAEEAAQAFFVDVIEVGLPRVRQERGRFRDYLKKVVRNRAITFLRRQGTARTERIIQELADTERPDSAVEREWLTQWRR